MPELDPADDFQDDGGTRAWRNNRATYSTVYDARPSRRRGMTWLELFGWFLVYPAFAIFGFYVVALLIAYNFGYGIWPSAAISLAIFAYPPLNRLLRRR